MTKNKNVQRQKNIKREKCVESSIADDFNNLNLDQESEMISNSENHPENIISDSLETLISRKTNSRKRLESLKSLNSLLIYNYEPGHVSSWIESITDTILRIGRKGLDYEKIEAINLICPLILHMVDDSKIAYIYKETGPFLTQIIQDNSKPNEVRIEAIKAMSLCCFIGFECGQDVLDLIKILDPLFYSSCNVIVEPVMDSLGLLLGLKYAYPMLHLNKRLTRLICLIKSENNNIRVSSCRMVLDVIENSGVELDELRTYKELNELEELINEICHNCVKKTNKINKRTQRTIFRKIISFITDKEIDQKIIKFGKRQVSLNTWALQRRYDALSNILKGGITSHLFENEFLRGILDLGPVNPDERCTKRNTISNVVDPE